MKYTKNIHNKLLLDGFKFDYEFVSPPEDDSNLYYTVYKKGGIEVTVCDSHKVVDIHLNVDEEELSHLSYTKLLQLDRLINKEK
jgi:hypothetical protein